MSTDPTPALREARSGRDDGVAVGLLVEYLEWANQRLVEEHGIVDPPTDPAHLRESLAEYRRPAGVLVLAELGGRLAGIGALRRLSDGAAEVKRMYVVPAFRGRHLGAAILDRLIDEARGMGATAMRLDTCRFMSEAQRLYRSRGFTERAPYLGSEIPPRLQHHWLFFEREL